MLVVPTSTVPSESVFSMGERIIDPHRCNLSISTVEALICTQSWLHTSHSKASVREAVEDIQSHYVKSKEWQSTQVGNIRNPTACP